ncbi:MAG: hypothetical protein KatS3mg050_0728 [Litorilinea sp.]|nr:MAG: hypothetical protein KatS3mg050_0728 [Litorilinea sp.]
MSTATPSAERLTEGPTGPILILSVERGQLQAGLLVLASGTYQLVTQQRVARQAEIPVTEQLGELIQRLGEPLGCRLWDAERGQPWLHSDDPIRFPPLEQVAIAASLADHPRVHLISLTGHVSGAAALEALAESPAQLVGHTSLSPDLTSASLSQALAATRPDAVIIAGGYEQAGEGIRHSLRELCRLVGQALSQVPGVWRPAVLYAGASSVAQDAAGLLQTRNGVAVTVVENVAPGPGQIRTAGITAGLQQLYTRLSQARPGYPQLAQWASRRPAGSPARVLPVETAFVHLVQLWQLVQGLPRLHGVLCDEAGQSWRLHVWAEEERVTLRYVAAQTPLQALTGWPPVRLLCGNWPAAAGPAPAAAWWDPTRLAPAVACVGQIFPLVTVHVLTSSVWRQAQGENPLA